MRVYADNWPRSIVIEVGPDSKDTPERDRDFYCERTPTGRTSLPKLPKKNELYVTANRGTGRRKKPVKILSPRQVHFRKLISHACAHLEVCCTPVRLLVEQTYGRKRTVAGVTYPAMDSDACLSAVRDAIQTPKAGAPGAHPRFAGLILDDGQIVSDRTISRYAPDVYALRIEITAAPDWGVDA